MTASASRRRFLMRLGCISSAAAACSIPTVCAWAAGTHTPVVVSFSWFENVNPAELAKTRIDATTGASLLNHGLTTRAAAWIAEEFELAHIVLRTLSPYPADYDQCLDQAIEEKTNRTLPRLQPISDRNRRALGQAELIYLVFPLSLIHI